ncbi:MAG: Uma2 family endonuclease, partial [Microcystis panniformis]
MVSKSPTITDAELIRLSCQNPELGFERNADGTLVTMPPIGSISANRELKAGARLLYWVEQNGLGEVFSSSGGFKLANSAVRSPDVAFVARERLPSGWQE